MKKAVPNHMRPFALKWVSSGRWQVIFLLYGAEFASSQHYPFREAKRICREVDRLMCSAKVG
jgi:hypothetical protein